MVPLNYAIQLSGPVTALTARRVRHGVRADLICQPALGPGIKTPSSPAAFPTALSLPFIFSPSLPCTRLSCLSPRRAPLAPFRAERYNLASKKNSSARPLPLIRSTPRQHFLVYQTDRTSTLINDVGGVPRFPDHRRLVRATDLDAGPLLPVLSSLVHQFIKPPHISGLVDYGRVSTLTGYVIAASSCYRSPPRLVLVEGGVRTGADHAATQTNGENAARSARTPLENCAAIRESEAGSK
jgi:hypothetical protein